MRSETINPVFQAVIDIEDAGFLLLDISGHVTYASEVAREMLSLPSVDSARLPLEALAFTVLTRLYHSALLNQGEVFVADVVLPETGEPGQLRVKSFASSDGSVAGALAVLRSTRKERELDRMKADFLAIVSHELRTPLTSILGYSNLLYEAGEAISPEDQKQFLQTIENQGRVLLELINDLLEMAKLDSDQLKLEKEACPPGAILSSVMNEYASRAEEAGIDLRMECECDLLAHCDPTRIQQAIGYLVDNALKFTPEGGSVIVAAYQKEGRVVLQVTDTGCGIAPENQTRLFEKFYQVDAGAARCVNGTGLGLAIVKRIVQLHCGDVFLESEADHGSTFGMTLPGLSTDARQSGQPAQGPQLALVSTSASLARELSAVAPATMINTDEDLVLWTATHSDGILVLDCEIEETHPELFRMALVCAHCNRLKVILTGQTGARWFSPFALRIMDDGMSMEEMTLELSSLHSGDGQGTVVFADAGDHGAESLLRSLELVADKVQPAHSRFGLRKRLEDPQVSLLATACDQAASESLKLLDGTREAGWLGNLAVFCSFRSELPETFGRWLCAWASEVTISEAQGRKRLAQLIPECLTSGQTDAAA